jgi:DNA repair photolyase
MSFEKGIFDKKGLVFDKERVLTYSKLRCPLECRYCFVDDLSASQQQRGVAYLSNEQMEILQNLPEEISLIMLGCDTEFFQNKKDALITLHRLADLKKDISVITKLTLSGSYISEIKEVSSKLEQQGNIFSFSISIPCLESSKIWEPKVSLPERRIETLKKLSNQGIHTFVAMRPLLPTISDDELSRIVEATKDFSIGYYSGPLYLKDLDPNLIPESILDNLAVERLQPHWMPEGNLFYKIERLGQMEYLRQIISESGKFFFDGAAEANDFLKKL